MSLILLKDLNPTIKRARVLVRVSRLWEYRGGRDDGDIRHLDIVPLDSEGNPIYAEVGSAALKSKMPLLREGNVYAMSRFIVVESKKKYRPVDTKFMIDITCHTIIEEQTDVPSGFPLYTYSLTSFTALPALIGETKAFVDVVAMITEISDVETIQLANQPSPTKRRSLTLRDASNDEMKLFIYGNRASEIDTETVVAAGQEKPVVAVFVGLLVKSHKNGACLSGNSACRWYLDADLPEIRDFVASLGGMFEPLVHVPAGSHAEPARGPLPEPEQRDLVDLAALSPYDFSPQGFRCVVTVTRINTNTSWCFASCNRCNKKSLPDGNGYRCPACYCASSKFKYKICLFATDGTTEEEFVFFGDVGRRLVRKEVTLLMRTVTDAGDMPSEIASLVGQSYQLVFTMTARSFQRMERSYQVKQVVCGYGRRNPVPAVRPPGPPPAGQSSSSSAGVLPSTPTSSPLPAATPSETVSANQLTPSTPPPEASPVLTTAVAVKDKLEHEKDETKVVKARKRLFKDDEPSDDSLANEDLHDDVGDVMHDDALPGAKLAEHVDVPTSKGLRKVPLAKKGKKV